MIKAINAQLKNNPFLNRVMTLVTGTAIGQLIAILALPFLTRLYDPESFSVLAVYVSTLSLLTVIACLRLEIAIPLPKSDRIAAALCVLAMGSVLFFTVLSALAVALAPNIFNSLTDNKISQFLWLIPMGVFAVGMYNALQYWSTRNKKFPLIAKTRVTQSLTGTTVKLGVGYLMGGWTAGLVFGQLVSQGAGFISLGRSLIKNDWVIFKELRLKHLKLALQRYDKFPKYSTWEAFANTGGIQIPIILIAYYAIGAEAGYLMIAMQLLSAPMGLIGGAVSQVYLSRAPEEHRNDNLSSFTTGVVSGLLKTGVGPLLFIGIVSPVVFPIVFGAEWQRAGELVAWMTPWMILQFIASPISMVMHVRGWQKYMLALTIAGLFLRVGTVLIACYWFLNYIAEFYILSGVLFYGACTFVFLKSAGIRFLGGDKILSFPVVAVIISWVFLGFLVCIFL